MPQSMDQYMEPAPHGHQDVLNNSTEVHPSNRTDQTDRAVYWIDPRSSGMEFWLEPRSNDRTDRTRARLSRPSRHSRDNSRARLSLGHEEPKDIHGFSPGRHTWILTLSLGHEEQQESLSLPPCIYQVQMNLDSSRRVSLTRT